MLDVKSTAEGEPGTYFSRGVLERLNAMLAVRLEKRKAAMIHHSNLNEAQYEGPSYGGSRGNGQDGVFHDISKGRATECD